MQKIEFPCHLLKQKSSIYISASVDLVSKIPRSQRIAAVIDEGALLSATKNFTQFFSSLNATVIQIPGGERCKNRDTKAFIEDKLLEQGHGVDTVILAIGGGATLDIVGFVAATFCRGVELIYIPTTLLAMVDASIGGKNGLNIHGAKNQIGTLYFPSKVLIDVTFLQTLPKKEIRNGIVEMVKHALLHSQEQVDRLLKNIPAIINGDKDTQLLEISESVRYKSSIIEFSKKDLKVRDLLNFGHTVGHAIEYIDGELMSPLWSHGQAVAKGMQVESELSFRKGILKNEELIKIREAIDSIGLEYPVIQHRSKNLWSQAFQFDKKTVNGMPRAVHLEAIGKPYVKDCEYTQPLTGNDIQVIIEECS